MKTLSHSEKISSLLDSRQILGWKASVRRLRASGVLHGMTLLAGACTFASQTHAATYVRTPGTTGDYGDTTLYSPTGTLPGSGDTVTSDGTGTVINFTAPDSGDALGTLSLNTTSGNTTFNQSAGTFTIGTLNFGSAGGTPVYNLTGGTLNVATISNIAAPTGASFNVAGGTVNYTGTGFYLGNGSGANPTISISAGTFNANSMTSLSLGVGGTGQGNIALSGTGVFNDSATASIYLGNTATSGTSTITLANSSQFNAANSTLVLGQFGGANGSLTIGDTASLTVANILLGGVNSSSTSYGVINLNGGTITTGSIQKGSASTTTPDATHNVLIANGGTVRASAASANFFNGAFVTLAAGGLTFDTNNNAVTITNAISGTGGFTKVGLGALSLNAGAASTYTGTTTIENGTIVAAIAGSFGNTTSAIALGDATSIANNYSVTLQENGNNTLARNITVGASNAATTGIYSIGSGNGSSSGVINGTVTLNQNLFVTSSNGSNSFTLAGSIVSGSAGTQTVSLNNTGNGAQNDSTVIGGGVGTIAVTKVGTGTSTLSGANTYTGATTVNRGTLSLTGSISSSSALALGGGTFAYAPTTASAQTVNGTTINQGSSAVTATTGKTLNLGTITQSAGGLVSFGGAGTITTSGTGANGILGPYAYIGTGTGLSYVTPTGTVAAFTGGTTTPDATGVTDTTGTVNYNVAAGGAVGAGASANTLRYTGAADTITGPMTLGGLMNAGTGALTVNGDVTASSTNELDVLSNGQNITLNGALGDNGANAVTLAYGGPSAGTLTLTSANTYSGPTTIGAGTLTLGGTGTLGSGGTYAGNIANNGALVVGTSSNQTLSGAVSGTGTLTQSGTGTLTLGGVNSYTGATTISTGTVNLTGTLGSGALVTGTGGGTAITSAATLNESSTGVIAGTSALTVTGGTTTLAGTNTFTGAISISAGATLALSGSGTLGGGTYAGTITDNGSFIVGSSSNQTLTGTINNGGSLTKNGNGTLIVTANNTYTGGTTINGGTLQDNFGGASFGALRGTATVNTGGTLALNAGDALGYNLPAAANSLTQLNIVGGTVNILVNANEGLTTNLTMTGGTFSSTGGGAFNIDPSQTNKPAINTNASTTTALISANIVNRGGTVALPFNVASGTTASGSDLTVSGVISGGGITKNGAGALTLTGLNTYTGGTAITAGTLLTGNTGTLGTSNVTVSGTGALTLGNSASIAGTATLNFAGSTTITLNNSTADSLNNIVDTDSGATTPQFTAGTAYTASQLDTMFNVSSFAGAGSLIVAVPEPATWLGGLMLVGTFGLALRRRVGTRFA